MIVGVAPLIPDGDEARRWAEQELSDPVYQAAEPTPFDRIARAIGDAIGSLFGNGVSADWGPVVAVIVLLVVVGLVVLAFVIWGRPRARARVRAARGELFGDDVTASAAELRRTARSLAAADDWDAAVIVRVRALARGLDERDIVHVSPGATVHGFARAASRVFAAEADALAQTARDFDDVRYLHRPGSAAAYERVSALDDRLATATATATAVSP